MRINLKRRYPDDHCRKIVAHLINQWCEDFDMEPGTAKSYIENNDKNLTFFIEYLNKSGYKVKRYRLVDHDDQVLSYGLDFDDDCELTLALRMRYPREEKKVK